MIQSLNRMHVSICMYAHWWIKCLSLYIAVMFSFILGFSRNCEKGAATSLNAAVNPELNKEEFVYYSDCQPARTSAAAM